MVSLGVHSAIQANTPSRGMGAQNVARHEKLPRSGLLERANEADEQPRVTFIGTMKLFPAWLLAAYRRCSAAKRVAEGGFRRAKRKPHTESLNACLLVREF